jgi:hypothetical protein
LRADAATRNMRGCASPAGSGSNRKHGLNTHNTGPVQTGSHQIGRAKSVFCRSKVNGHVIAAERLEETLQICVQMWSDDDSPYVGKHYRLERTLNSPQALSRPHPPVLIGGAGERKTLRLVAQ